jgi:LPS-assembly protein
MQPLTDGKKHYPVTIHKPILFASMALGLLAWLPITAAADQSDGMWGLCPHMAPQADAAPSENASTAPAPTYLNSDYGEGKLDELYTLTGHVSIRRGPQQIEADKAVYDSRTGLVEATGNVRFKQGGLITQGTAARFNLDTRTGEVDSASYDYVQSHAHGQAATIRHENADITRLFHATYTTCDPNKVDWELRARTITLNHADAVGEAYNVSLRFKDVPFFYFPYINFPLNNQRKSGLLPPTLGYSHANGLDLAVPVYWNIAPNRDATITPRIIGHRGLLTKGEFRYLSESSKGELQAEFLPNDRKFGADRGALEYQNRTQFSPRWNSNLIANYVSDDQYLSELGNSLAAASITQVERRVDLNHNGDYTSFLARLQGYQTLDPTLPATSRPYQRLPQLQFTSATPAHPFTTTYRFDGELVRFERDSSLTGMRLNLTPSLAWPMETQGYFFTPKIGVNHTQYQLDGQTPGDPTDPSLTTPVYSIDGGLFLEREIAFGEHSFLQTLEPRLYYLRIPYRDQSNLPLFDTSAFDFSFAQLFRENRFSGADRLGDANQISIAVTSRLIDQDSGREWLSGSLGQIVYLDDRQVTLGDPPQDSQTSDLVAEASTHLSKRWSSSLETQWNPDIHKTDEAAVQFHYDIDDRHLLNAGYRFRRDQLNQTDLSFLWLLNPRWQLLGRWNYSQRDHRTLETLAGVQYESCCWIFRVTNRRYVSDLSGDNNRSFYLQLELKGLASIGHSVEDVLERDILGYRPGY